MKKTFTIVLCHFLFFASLSFGQVTRSSASMSPEAKAFLVVCGYGTVGGALLGLASMAFGKDGKAIAQGASLGLYAGIIFGSYVLYTHKMQDDYLPQDDGYEDVYGKGFSTRERYLISSKHYHSFKLKEDQSFEVGLFSVRF